MSLRCAVHALRKIGQGNTDSTVAFPPDLGQDCLYYSLICFLYHVSFRVLYAVGPLVVPKEEELASDEPVTQKNTSFTTLVYGKPVGKMSTCINAYRVQRLCTDFKPNADTTKFMGHFGDSLAYFTWSHGRTDRGNVFRNATWTLSGDSSHELFPRTKFVLRFSSNNGDKRMKKFLFNPEGDNQAHLCPCRPAVASTQGELMGYFHPALYDVIPSTFPGRQTTCVLWRFA